jgi:ribonuclease Z
MHVNVLNKRLLEMGLQGGPWLNELKRKVAAGHPDDDFVRAAWKDFGVSYERDIPLGELKARALEIVPGEKICYVTDVVFHERNLRAIVELARGADLLFIESVFLEAEAAHAQKKQHLTARQAGTIARAAGVKEVIPFHFSPRYMGREAAIHEELRQAFEGRSEPARAAGT